MLSQKKRYCGEEYGMKLFHNDRMDHCVNFDQITAYVKPNVVLGYGV